MDARPETRGGRALATRLRTETAAAHAALERLAVGTRFLSDAAAYGRYLGAQRAFHAALEDALAGVPGLAALLPDLADRRKTPWLDADLAALGLAPPTQRPAIVLPTVARGLGAAYVVEGATLGGRYVLAHLDRAIPADARRFFNGYGSETGGRWRTFLGSLAAAPDADAVVGAANAAFREMHAWLVAVT